jgi:hypothetical protein
MSDSDDEFHSAEDMEANRKREAVLSYWAAATAAASAHASCSA